MKDNLEEKQPYSLLKDTRTIKGVYTIGEAVYEVGKVIDSIYPYQEVNGDLWFRVIKDKIVVALINGKNVYAISYINPK